MSGTTGREHVLEPGPEGWAVAVAAIGYRPCGVNEFVYQDVLDHWGRVQEQCPVQQHLP
jgi:hypothetical protein